MSIGIGDALREAREETGRTVEEAARDTRVRTDYLRALEDEEFSRFGGDVYAKGFLSTYARYLHLDPAPLLDLYRRNVQDEIDDYAPTALASQPISTTPRGAAPRWIAWVVVALIVLAGIVVVGNVFGGRAPTPADGAQAPPQAASTSPSESAPSSGPTSSAPAEVAPPSPSPTPTFDGVNLLLALEDASWMRVTVDGTNVLEQVVARGETLTFQGATEIEVRFGNPGGVRVELNGQDLGAPGERGQPRTVTFTPEGQAPA